MEGTPGGTHGGRALRADGRQVHQDNAADVPSENELKTALEKGSDEQKIETMVRLQHCTAMHTALHTPRQCSSMVDNRTEEDPGHYAQRRRQDGPPHAHNTIRHAQQIEAAQKAHVLLLRGVPEARCSGQAAAGVDPGLVC